MPSINIFSYSPCPNTCTYSYPQELRYENNTEHIYSLEWKLYNFFVLGFCFYSVLDGLQPRCDPWCGLTTVWSGLRVALPWCWRGCRINVFTILSQEENYKLSEFEASNTHRLWNQLCCHFGYGENRSNASWNSPLLLSPITILWPDVYNGLFTVTALLFLTTPGYSGLQVRMWFCKQLNWFIGLTLLKGWYFIFDTLLSKELHQTFRWASRTY